MEVMAEVRFWLSHRAWRYAATEGFRAAAIAGSTIFLVWGMGWIFRTDTDLFGQLLTGAYLALLVAAPVFLCFTVWARCDLWRDNQVKSK